MTFDFIVQLFATQFGYWWIIWLGIRNRKTLVLVPLVTAAIVYVLFIAILDTAFPHGPIEHALAALRAMFR